jgi:anti-sigma B factor antagonist
MVPPARNLRISSSVEAHLTLVALVGEVDVASASRLVDAVTELDVQDRTVILDLSEVSFLDSSGVRALLQCEAHIAQAGGRLALMKPSEIVIRVLDLVDLRRRIPEVDDVTSASLPQH